MHTHRKLTTLFFTALLLSGAPAAFAGVYSSTPQKIREVPNHRGLEVEIWTDRGDGARYRAGEPIEVLFRTNADAWVAIYDLDTRGQVTRLFPSSAARNNFVRGGVVHRVPSHSGHHFAVEGPSGWETLRAVASTNRHALASYAWNDERHDERDARYDDRGYDDRGYDDRGYDDRGYDDRDGDGSYHPATSRVTAVPDKIREVPGYPPHSEVVTVGETRHYVLDGYRPAPRSRPSRPWWKR